MWDTVTAIPVCDTNTVISAIEPISYVHTLTLGELIATEEKDNKKTTAYNIAGIKIKCDKIFKNKTKETSLHFYGDGKVLGKEISFDETIFVNTNIYDKYDWYVNNGILYVVLFEKINEAPSFERAEKSKKTKEEVNQ